MVKVHYFYDPLCGWCYGASSLIKQLLQTDDVEIELHPAGLFINMALDLSFREHIVAADKTIHSLTNAEFGEKYIHRVKSDDSFQLDSSLAIQAILAFEHLGKSPFEMLFAIQLAHYVEGRNVSDTKTIEAIAKELSIPSSDWQLAMMQSENSVKEVTLITRKLANNNQVIGYPSLFIEQQGQLIPIELSKYYQTPKEFLSMISNYSQIK